MWKRWGWPATQVDDGFVPYIVARVIESYATFSDDVLSKGSQWAISQNLKVREPQHLWHCHGLKIVGLESKTRVLLSLHGSAHGNQTLCMPPGTTMHEEFMFINEVMNTCGDSKGCKLWRDTQYDPTRIFTLSSRRYPEILHYSSVLRW